MDNNKSFVIIIVAFFGFCGCAIIFGVDTDSKEVKLEKEKTKQLMVQYKIDSLSAMQNKNIGK